MTENEKKKEKKPIDTRRLIRQITGVLVGIIMMGFSISWLVPCGFGTDGYTALNLAVSDKLGITFGTWQAVFNCILFIPIIIWGRKMIGFGMFANMLCVGYICDFFSWIWSLILPENLFGPMWVRIVIVIPALLCFVFGAAIYMDMDLGASPYDALPFIIHERVSKVPFKLLRIGYDVLFVIIGYFFGAPFSAVTLAMAFLLGPVIEFVGKKLKPLILKDDVKPVN